ncbi:MAG TPA: hypothetical protein VJN18_26945 [Polyangiaceae bacterium]|nr:hypothetical protein [Polyangiaceae bacterium]
MLLALAASLTFAWPRFVQGPVVIVAWVVVVLVLVIVGLPAAVWLKHPKRHPASKRIRRWGDRDTMSRTIERSLQSTRYRCGNGWSVTDEFIVRSTLFTFDVFRLNDLIWAYKKVTTSLLYGLVPVHRANDAVLVFADGKATLLGLLAPRQ